MASAVLAESLAPIEPEESLSLAERAFRRLRDAILRGQLPAGAKVSERGLAQQLGIQGTPALVVGQKLLAGAVDLADLRAAVADARAGR